MPVQPITEQASKGSYERPEQQEHADRSIDITVALGKVIRVPISDERPRDECQSGEESRTANYKQSALHVKAQNQTD